MAARCLTRFRRWPRAVAPTARAPVRELTVVAAAAATRWPTFLVIGAYKSGTTALHHALRGHPQVFVPERKEPSFFAFADAPDASNPAYGRSVHDEASYLAMFMGAGDARAVGEVSP